MRRQGPKDYYKPGEWNACCDVCSFKFKSSELRRRWDNLMVCDKDYEERHPQDLIRVPQEHPEVPWARPRANYDEKVFVTFGPADPSLL